MYLPIIGTSYSTYFAGYTRELLYILLNFQVSEKLYRGPEFLL